MKPTPLEFASKFALPALIAGAIGISFSPIFARISELGPTATAFHRVLLAAPVLWAFLAYTDRHVKPASSFPEPLSGPRGLNRREFWLLVFAGVAFAGDLGFWHWSIKLTSVANSTLLANLTPIFVTLTAWLMFRERVSGLFLIALVLALGGVTVMVRASFAIDSAHVWGDVLGIITAVFYAAYLMSVKLLRETLSTLRIMAWSTAITAICLFPIAIISGNELIAVTWAGWAVLIGIAWFFAHRRAGVDRICIGASAGSVFIGRTLGSASRRGVAGLGHPRRGFGNAASARRRCGYFRHRPGAPRDP